MKNNRKPRSTGYLLAGAGLAICAGLALLVVGRFGAVILKPAAAEIVFDDFGFTALEAHATSRIGKLDATPGKWFYIVRVRAANHAKRVDYHFEPDMAKLYSESGELLPNSQAGQDALDKQLPFPQMSPILISPGGGTSERLVVFSGPAGLGKVRMAFSSSDTVGGVLDVLLLGNQFIEVSVSKAGAYSVAGLK